jgi:hypothetical protein
MGAEKTGPAVTLTDEIGIVTVGEDTTTVGCDVGADVVVGAEVVVKRRPAVVNEDMVLLVAMSEPCVVSNELGDN